MTGSALAATLVMAAVVVLGLVVVLLGREVHRLRVEVETLGQALDRPPRDQHPGPVPPKPLGDVAPAQTRAPDEAARDEVVIRPTTLGPAEVEPDPGVARVASVTLSAPLIKVAAFSHGVRRALDEESRMRVAYAFRKELRRQRRVRRKRAVARSAGPPRDGGWHP